MERVFVAIGSNIDREYHVGAGLRALRERFGPLSVSTVYQCPAVGFDGDDFLNLVVGFDSAEHVHDVYEALHAIENRYGRDRSLPRYSPRSLDLDLLLFDDRIVRDGTLVLPRPGIERVAFVLCPLAELAGAHPHPVLGIPLVELWARFDGIGADELVPVDPRGIVPPQ